jgi:hypothetical protein
MKPVDVRSQLVEALRIDLVGPENGPVLEAEVLSQAPSRWYLTRFLAPLEAEEPPKSAETAGDSLDVPAAGNDGTDDDATPEPPTSRRAFRAAVVSAPAQRGRPGRPPSGRCESTLRVHA